MKKDSKIFIAGHQGMVGSMIKGKLEAEGYSNLLCRTRKALDLTNQAAVKSFFDKERPEYVFLAAAKVGGIKANDNFSAEFIYQNLMIQCNVIHSAYLAGVKKLMALGSSCIYPKFAPQPIQEEALLTGLLEPTNEAYAIAKISGIKMCRMYRKQYGCDYISIMPTNLYGPGDNYHPENSHVIPGLINRFHEAKITNKEKVVCWGTGSVKREFLYVEDLADACLFIMLNYSGAEHINVGTGVDVTIKELAELVAETTGYKGEVDWDTTVPDGTPRKLLDVSKLNRLGWKYITPLEEGLDKTYAAFKKLVS